MVFSTEDSYFKTRFGGSFKLPKQPLRTGLINSTPHKLAQLLYKILYRILQEEMKVLEPRAIREIQYKVHTEIHYYHSPSAVSNHSLKSKSGLAPPTWSCRAFRTPQIVMVDWRVREREEKGQDTIVGI